MLSAAIFNGALKVKYLSEMLYFAVQFDLYRFIFYFSQVEYISVSHAKTAYMGPLLLLLSEEL